MRIAVVGAGYVGLVTASCLAELGHDVTCVDTDTARVESIQQAKPPFHEEGLASLVSRNLGSRLGATTDFVDACTQAEVAIVAVGTPLVNGVMDDRYLRAAVAEVARTWRGRHDYPVLVIKSTVLPSTTDEIVVRMAEATAHGKAGSDFGVAVNPEFLTEGQAVADFFNPDRIVVGTSDNRSADVLREMYSVLSEAPILFTSMRNAEMIKYASNALLATLISFSNEIANIGAAIGGVDVVEVMNGLHSSRYLTLIDDEGHSRPAPISAYLMAGSGYGGSCLPKDVKALAAAGRAAGEQPWLLEAVTAVNAHQPSRLVRILQDELGPLAGVNVSVLGLAFKPDTSDTRESPSLEVINRLLQGGARVIAHDPIVQSGEVADLVEAGLVVTDDLGFAVGEAAAIVLVTRWSDYEKLADVVAGRFPPPLVVDGRRALDPTQFERFRAIGL